jgi:DNA-binding NarL/FixJ family response regulator
LGSARLRDLVSIIRRNGAAGIIVSSRNIQPDTSATTLSAGADIVMEKLMRTDQIVQAIASLASALIAPKSCRLR